MDASSSCMHLLPDLSESGSEGDPDLYSLAIHSFMAEGWRPGDDKNASPPARAIRRSTERGKIEYPRPRINRIKLPFESPIQQVLHEKIAQLLGSEELRPRRLTGGKQRMERCFEVSMVIRDAFWHPRQRIPSHKEDRFRSHSTMEGFSSISGKLRMLDQTSCLQRLPTPPEPYQISDHES